MIEAVEMADPIWDLRLANAILSCVFAPVTFYVFMKSKHHVNAFYRFGMLGVTCGLVVNIAMAARLLPVNIEFWMLKDLGIYLTVGSLAYMIRRGGDGAVR